MEIKPSYNPESNTFFLEISSNLLENYFNNLRGMLLDDNFKNLEVIKKGCDTALITFTVSKDELPSFGEDKNSSTISDLLNSKDLPEELRDMVSKLSEDLDEDVNVVAVPLNDTTNPIGKMNQLINDFINSAISHKIRNTEFVPLINYPYDKLREDIVEAVKAKRNICIVDDYFNYLKSTGDKSLVFNQYYINYIDSEYADAAILIKEDNIKEFKKQFSSILKEVSWI